MTTTFNRCVTVIAVALMCGLCAGMASAQVTPSPFPGEIAPKHMVVHPSPRVLALELGLNRDQTQKIQAIYDDTHQKVMAIKADSKLTSEEKHEQIREAQRDKRDQVSEVLNNVQKREYAKMAWEGDV